MEPRFNGAKITETPLIKITAACCVFFHSFRFVSVNETKRKRNETKRCGAAAAVVATWQLPSSSPGPTAGAVGAAKLERIRKLGKWETHTTADWNNDASVPPFYGTPSIRVHDHKNNKT